jgi:hypothetical protein
MEQAGEPLLQVFGSNAQNPLSACCTHPDHPSFSHGSGMVGEGGLDHGNFNVPAGAFPGLVQLVQDIEADRIAQGMQHVGQLDVCFIGMVKDLQYIPFLSQKNNSLIAFYHIRCYISNIR